MIASLREGDVEMMWYIEESRSIPEDIKGKYKFPNFGMSYNLCLKYLSVVSVSNKIYFNIVGDKV
jgi:hypothetical protein